MNKQIDGIIAKIKVAQSCDNYEQMIELSHLLLELSSDRPEGFQFLALGLNGKKQYSEADKVLLDGIEKMGGVKGNRQFL